MAVAARKRATLRDVADAVGVHLSTVSRALDPRTRHLITDPVADRILAAARSMDYLPNAVASSLRTRRTTIVGVIIPDITNPIFPPMVRGLEDVLAPRGYATLIVNSDNDRNQETRAIDMLRGRGIDGLVLASVTRRDAAIDGLLADGMPLVAINRTTEGHELSAVLHDELHGIAAVVDHLVSLGHRDIAHIAGPADLSTGAGRRDGFLARIAHHELKAGTSLIAQAVRFTEAEGHRCAHELLNQARPFTAIAAGNDLLALGAITALHERGLHCPNDISVTGYNDMPLVDRLSPSLTTVRIQTYEAGRRAALIMLSQIERPQSPIQIETLPVELIVRGSTARRLP